MSSSGTCALIVLAVCGGLWTAGTHGQSSPVFTDVTAETGLDFVHRNGADGRVAAARSHRRRRRALRLRQRRRSRPVRGAERRARRTPAPAARDAAQPVCIATISTRTAGRLRFTDVTERSGIAAAGYGMGAATGDIDNDGWIDLYVTSLGSNSCFATTATARSPTSPPRAADRRSAAGARAPRSSTSTATAGSICSSPTTWTSRADMKRACFSAGSRARLLQPGRLRRRRRPPAAQQRATARSPTSRRTAGISRAPGRGLGVLAADVNDDGWTDLYVANDGDANQLWINERGIGHVPRRRAARRRGRQPRGPGRRGAWASMPATSTATATRICSSPIWTTKATRCTSTSARACSRSAPSSGACSRLGFTGFGTRFVDYDNDGWLDLLVVNGAVRHLDAQRQTRRRVSAEAAQPAVSQRRGTAIRGRHCGCRARVRRLDVGRGARHR